MPNPVQGESDSAFVSRYVGSKEAQKSFPKQSQRVAVAYSKAKKAKNKVASRVLS